MMSKVTQYFHPTTSIRNHYGKVNLWGWSALLILLVTTGDLLWRYGDSAPIVFRLPFSWSLVLFLLMTACLITSREDSFERYLCNGILLPGYLLVVNLYFTPPLGWYAIFLAVFLIVGLPLSTYANHKKWLREQGLESKPSE
jgi:uncharacterized membrane protein YesL